MSCAVEIVSVGNELLIGKIANSNAQWLAQRLASLGLTVKRITVVRDHVEEISGALREVIRRRPSLVIVTGGLGPTFDDKTLEAVADAVRVPLRTNRQALKMISEGVRGGLGRSGLGPAYVKMARLPMGSKTLPNPVGLAPGVSLEVHGVEVICLPGVPLEMKAIFDQSVAPVIRRLSGAKCLYESSLRVSRIWEPEIAPLIEVVSQDNPHVYIKSHPKLGQEGSWIELHLSMVAEKSAEGDLRISRAKEQIRSLIEQNGGVVDDIPAKPCEEEV